MPKGYGSSGSGCGKDAASRSETVANRRCDNSRGAGDDDAHSAVGESVGLKRSWHQVRHSCRQPAVLLARRPSARSKAAPRSAAALRLGPRRVRQRLPRVRRGQGRARAKPRRRSRKSMISSQSSPSEKRRCDSGFARPRPGITNLTSTQTNAARSNIVLPARHPIVSAWRYFDAVLLAMLTT